MPLTRTIPPLTSLKLADTPRAVRRWARFVLFLIVAAPIALMFVPWQQTVHGTGAALAFDPTERMQYVVAPIEGRVKDWKVQEGRKVKAGDLLLEMLDNDPFLLERLQDEEQAIQSQSTFATERVTEIESRITGLQQALSIQVGIAETLIDVERRNLDAALAAESAAKERVALTKITYDRNEKLFRDGKLVSEQVRDDSKTAFDIAVPQLKAAEEQTKAARLRLQVSEARPKEIRKLTEVALAGEKASMNLASESVQTIQRSRLALQSRIARQRQQNVFSPTDGTVFRILANGEAGGQLVRPGERLATIVPDIKEGPERDRAIAEQAVSTIGLLSAAPLSPAPLLPQIAIGLAPPKAILSLTREDYPGIVAELFVDGNDLPLVREGDRVRLQFEGWAAIQFVAYPKAASGTFGGIVYLVDPTANEKGDFRILVRSDPDDEPWPAQDRLRQGVRAQGWVILPKPVTMGWEIWRQLNGFPPYREEQKKKAEAGAIGPVPQRKRK